MNNLKNQQEILGNAVLAESFLPTTAVLEVTYLCNHVCFFCSCPWESPDNVFSKTEIEINEWKNIITKLCKMGVSNFAFTGGEPLLKKGIEELIEFASTQQVKVILSSGNNLISEIKSPSLYLISNATAMSDKILDVCKKFNVHLSMSLPGLKTYFEHTKNGSAQNVLNWFSKAKSVGLSTTVNITVTKKNLFELYETLGNALVAGADNLLMNRFLPGGRGLDFQEYLLDKSEINNMLRTAEHVLSEAQRYGNIGTELPQCIIEPFEYKHLTIGTQCAAAKDFFVISPSGNVRTCNHSPLELCNWKDIDTLNLHPYWKQFVFREYLPEMCNGCNISYACDGGCREAASITGGKINSIDPLFSK